MNKVSWFLLLSGIVGFSLPTWAGSSYTGRVKVHCNADTNHCNLYIVGTASGAPACAGNPNWYVFKMNSPVWEEQLAIAIAAQVAGRNVAITGTGSCTQRPDAHEDLSAITLED